MTKKNLNGSVDVLAKAMRQVFSEAVEVAVQPVHDRLDTIEDKMATKNDLTAIQEKMADDLNTTNKNVQAQFAQHRKDVAGDMKKIVKDR